MRNSNICHVLSRSCSVYEENYLNSSKRVKIIHSKTSLSFLILDSFKFSNKFKAIFISTTSLKISEKY